MRFSITPYKYIIYIIFFLQILILLSHSSCFKDQKENWIGKKLLIPEFISNNRKIVTRFEGDCPACIETIKQWEKFYNEIKEVNSEIKLIFYVEIIREEDFLELEQKLEFADTVIFDQRACFYRKNLLKFPYGIETQTFLLNGKNEVILFGNPITNKKLYRKYIRKI